MLYYGLIYIDAVSCCAPVSPHLGQLDQNGRQSALVVTKARYTPSMTRRRISSQSYPSKSTARWGEYHPFVNIIGAGYEFAQGIKRFLDHEAKKFVDVNRRFARRQ